MDILVGFLIAAVIILLVVVFRARKNYIDLENLRLQQLVEKRDEQKTWADEREALIETVEKVKAERAKTESRNKSVEVRTGQIMETVAPFMEAFKRDPKGARFLGWPIDFVWFGDDEIVFIEVKSGKARLTKSQKNIRDIVENGNVKFKVVRFDYG